MNFWIMARFQADEDVWIVIFLVDVRADGAILVALYQDIEKGYFPIDFFFPSKFYSWMNIIEALVEVGCWVGAVVAVAAEAGAYEVA